ncbi:MAG: EamA family transporter, partial [Firmicutes bacterium]|nr:EamA family transporter [Candidatus Caballimonas caccae]
IGYIGLRYIELSLSSPICNSSGAVTSIFLLVFYPSFILEGVSLLGIIIGVTFCTIGVVGLGIIEASEDDALLLERQKDANRKYAKSFLALLLPFLYCLIDAGGTIADTFILEEMDEQVANVSYGLTFFAMGIIAFIFVYLIKREKFSIKTEWAKGTGAICETVGQVAYIFAISENAVVSAPIISCYCALSVIWGRIFLKEKLSFWHYLMIGITIVGIVVLGIFGG